MRLFTAIDLPQSMLLKLERLQSALRPEAFIKWSPLDNLHITTKFIGEWPEERLDQMTGALEKIVQQTPFNVELRHLGWFPDERSPRVLWVGTGEEGPLRALAEATDECLLPLGIAKEDRAFSPHLTLARMKNPVPLDKLRKKVHDMQSTELGAFPVTRFVLYRSDPGSNFSIYRKLQVYPFESATAAAQHTSA
jgi:2'-5' RNA ligase